MKQEKEKVNLPRSARWALSVVLTFRAWATISTIGTRSTFAVFAWATGGLANILLVVVHGSWGWLGSSSSLGSSGFLGQLSVLLGLGGTSNQLGGVGGTI